MWEGHWGISLCDLGVMYLHSSEQVEIRTPGLLADPRSITLVISCSCGADLWPHQSNVLFIPLLAISAKVVHLSRVGFVAAFWSFQTCSCWQVAPNQTPPELYPSEVYIVRTAVSSIITLYICGVFLNAYSSFLELNTCKSLPFTKYLWKYPRAGSVSKSLWLHREKICHIWHNASLF